MKKLLILILALAVAVGGYFVVNLNWAALFQTTSTLTEDDARTLLLEAFGGEIVSMSHNDSATPYYVAELQVGEETIIAEVDAISSRITTKQVVEDDSEAVDDANEPELPLTKESALELALAEFEGEAVDIILVERGGEQFYEVELQSDSEHALFSYNVATGKLVDHETTELSSTSIQTVASTIKGSASNNSATSKDEASNNSTIVEKPKINQTEASSTVSLTIDQAEQIALRKVNGEVKSSTVTSENVFEFEIDQRGKLFVVKINATNGLVIETSSN